ncbi:hypothetical protein BKA18_006966 [Streptomyces auratus]
MGLLVTGGGTPDAEALSSSASVRHRGQYITVIRRAGPSIRTVPP